jgi:hypothetical protein
MVRLSLGLPWPGDQPTPGSQPGSQSKKPAPRPYATVRSRRPGRRGGREAAAVGKLAGRTDEVAELVAVAEGPRIGGLGQDQVPAVAGREVVEVGPERGQRTVPERVVRQADHVELDALGEDVVIEVPGVAIRSAAVDVDHHRQRVAGRVALAGPGDAGLEQHGELRPVLAIGPVHLTEREQHPVGDLVADLHHVHRRALPGERRDGVPGVRTDGAGQRRQALPGPRARNRLLARIRPEVRVVQVQQHLHARLLRAPTQRQRRAQRAVPGRRRVPHPQPNEVGAPGGQNPLNRLRHPTVPIGLPHRLFLQRERARCACALFTPLWTKCDPTHRRYPGRHAQSRTAHGESRSRRRS